MLQNKVYLQMLYLFRHISLCFSWKSCFEKKMRKNNIIYIYFSSNFWGNKFKFKFVALHVIRQGSKDFLLKNNCNNCTWSGRYLAIDVNILNSGSGSRSMENIIDPDPAKWCGSFGSGSANWHKVRQLPSFQITIYLLCYCWMVRGG